MSAETDAMLDRLWDNPRFAASIERARERNANRIGFCGNPECSCWQPSTPCCEFMDSSDDLGRCARCGNVEVDHIDTTKLTPRVSDGMPANQANYLRFSTASGGTILGRDEWAGTGRTKRLYDVSDAPTSADA